MVCIMDNLGRKISGEHTFYAEGRGAGGWYQSEAVTYSEDMRVDSHGGLMKDDTQNHVGGLASYTGQTGQVLNGGGYFSSIFVMEHGGHPHQMTCLVVRVGDTADVIIDYLGCGMGHSLGIGVVVQQTWSDHVHPAVGTLCTQDNGHQQSKWTIVMEFCLYYGHSLLEVGCYLLVEFSFSHLMACVLSE